MTFSTPTGDYTQNALLLKFLGRAIAGDDPTGAGPCFPYAPRAGAPSFTRSLRDGGAFGGLSVARPPLRFFAKVGTARRPAVAFSRLTNLSQYANLIVNCFSCLITTSSYGSLTT